VCCPTLFGVFFADGQSQESDFARPTLKKEML
jgi:hypothetical protein